MGKNKKTFVPHAPWAARKPDEGGYFRLTGSLLYSDAALSLKPAAFRVLIYMLQHSTGKPLIEFPRSRYEKFITRGGFQKTVDELVTAGFIEVVEKNAYRRKPNIYRFSAKWQDYVKPDEKSARAHDPADSL